MTPEENCTAFLNYIRVKHPKDIQNPQLLASMVNALAVVWSRT